MAVPDYLCLLDPWSEKSENCRDTFFAGMLNLGRDNADFVLSWEDRYQSPSERESKYLVDFLLNRFLLVKGPSLLTGRRIALLSSGDLAIVPGEARKGDQILFSLIYNKTCMALCFGQPCRMPKFRRYYCSLDMAYLR